MELKPNDKYKIFYKHRENNSPAPPLPKRVAKERSLFQRLAYEKMTIMLIPHNEAKNFHFHISMITILFFAGLFLSVLLFSAAAVWMQIDIEDQAESLHKEALEIRKQLFMFKDNVIQFHRKMASISTVALESSITISSYDNGFENYLDTSPSYALLPHNQLFTDNLYPFKKLQENVIMVGSLMRAARSFLETRRDVIIKTPSIWPTAGGHITSLYGYRRDPFTYALSFHSALDIAAPWGTPVLATAPGVVSQVGYNGGYGNYVQIQHNYGFSTMYAHNSSVLVHQGQQVSKGQQIARVGHTGRATGDHVHYEVQVGNYTINPYPFLNHY